MGMACVIDSYALAILSQGTPCKQTTALTQAVSASHRLSAVALSTVRVSVGFLHTPPLPRTLFFVTKLGVALVIPDSHIVRSWPGLDELACGTFPPFSFIAQKLVGVRLALPTHVTALSSWCVVLSRPSRSSPKSSLVYGLPCQLTTPFGPLVSFFGQGIGDDF